MTPETQTSALDVSQQNAAENNAPSDTTPKETKGNKRAKTMTVLLLRGYNVEAGISGKRQAGEIVELPESTAKNLIRNGIATFPDEE